MLELYKPRMEDLWFREQLLSDEAAMVWNRPWGGTIPFPAGEWQEWYETWVLCEDGTRFYRYLREPDSGEFVGELLYQFIDDSLLWLAGIIIASAFHGRGYGRQGLELLGGLASARGIELRRDEQTLADPSLPLLTGNGFKEEYRTEDIILLKQDFQKTRMKLTEEYNQLMEHYNLPERFRAGDFGLFEDEAAILREFVDNFYAAAQRDGYVALEDFTELMAFLDILWGADTDEVQNILTYTFMRSAKIQNALLKAMIHGLPYPYGNGAGPAHPEEDRDGAGDGQPL